MENVLLLCIAVLAWVNAALLWRQNKVIDKLEGNMEQLEERVEELEQTEYEEYAKYIYVQPNESGLKH